MEIFWSRGGFSACAAQGARSRSARTDKRASLDLLIRSLAAKLPASSKTTRALPREVHGRFNNNFAALPSDFQGRPSCGEVGVAPASGVSGGDGRNWGAAVSGGA